MAVGFVSIDTKTYEDGVKWGRELQAKADMISTPIGYLFVVIGFYLSFWVGVVVLVALFVEKVTRVQALER